MHLVIRNEQEWQSATIKMRSVAVEGCQTGMCRRASVTRTVRLYGLDKRPEKFPFLVQRVLVQLPMSKAKVYGVAFCTIEQAQELQAAASGLGST